MGRRPSCAADLHPSHRAPTFPGAPPRARGRNRPKPSCRKPITRLAARGQGSVRSKPRARVSLEALEGRVVLSTISFLDGEGFTMGPYPRSVVLGDFNG